MTRLAFAVDAAAIDHGGTLIHPRGAWGPLETELSMLGVTGTGDGPAGAARSWTKHVLRAWAATEAGDAA